MKTQKKDEVKIAMKAGDQFIFYANEDGDLKIEETPRGSISYIAKERTGEWDTIDHEEEKFVQISQGLAITNKGRVFDKYGTDWRLVELPDFKNIK